MASAGKDIQEMQQEIEQYESLTRGNIAISMIDGTADNPHQHHGKASKTDGGFNGAYLSGGDPTTNFNGTWQVGDWGNTLQFTPFGEDSED